jgi:hypothetical protein
MFTYFYVEFIEYTLTLVSCALCILAKGKFRLITITRIKIKQGSVKVAIYVIALTFKNLYRTYLQLFIFQFKTYLNVHPHQVVT